MRQKRSLRAGWTPAVLCLAGLSVAVPVLAQEIEPSPPPVPWQKIEAWALSAPDASAPPKDHPKEPVKAPLKEAPADVARETPKDAPKDTPKEVAKDAPKETHKDTSKEPAVAAPTWTPSRSGERRPEPPAFKAMQDQMRVVMSQRLEETQKTNFKRLAEIYMALEQYDKSLGLLNQMLGETRRYKEELGSGWINGNLWECALLCRNKPPAAWIQQQFDDWKVKETARIEAYVLNYGVSYREKLMKAFHEKADYFAKDGPTAAERVKELELKGDTSLAALAEIRERCIGRRPYAPLTHLRVLYKLRDWYPDLPESKSGETNMAVIRHLGYGFGMYREGLREAESLMEKAPTCGEVTRGAALYYAAEFAYQHAERLAPDPEDGWTPSDRTRPVYREAREYWERARMHFYRLKKEYPKNPANEISLSTGTSDVDRRLAIIATPARLGPAKPQ